MTKARPRRSRTKLSFVEKRWLLSGRPFCVPFLEGGQWARRLWREFGSVVVERHIARRPGSRPWGWWKYDAPERWNSSAESQLAFLQRLGLLTAEEKERLPHLRPRLARPAAPAQPASAHPLSPLETTPLSSDRTVEKGYQFVLIDDRVQLVRK